MPPGMIGWFLLTSAEAPDKGSLHIITTSGHRPRTAPFQRQALLMAYRLAQDHQGFSICIFQARGLCIPFLKCG